MAIKSKIILIFLGLVLLPMIIGLTVLFSYVRDVVMEVRILQLENIVNLEKSRVESFFKERKEDVQLFQTSPAIRDNLPVAIKYQADKKSPQYLQAEKALEDRLDAVRQQISREFPNENINVTYDNDTPFVRGTVKDVNEADRVMAIAGTLGKPVNLLRVDVPPVESQILLKVRFANVDRAAEILIEAI